MRRYDDPVEVRKGMVGDAEGPEQFLWRGRLWKVYDVLAHWVETGPWWQLGDGTDPDSRDRSHDLAAEREIWRVEAGRGLSACAEQGHGHGVFDLSFDWAQGSWRLARCAD